MVRPRPPCPPQLWQMSEPEGPCTLHRAGAQWCPRGSGLGVAEAEWGDQHLWGGCRGSRQRREIRALGRAHGGHRAEPCLLGQ